MSIHNFGPCPKANQTLILFLGLAIFALAACSGPPTSTPIPDPTSTPTPPKPKIIVPKGQVLEIRIEPKLAPWKECGGLGGLPCMMMHGPDGREALHQQIRGFDYHEGYTWILKVRRTKCQEPLQTETPSHIYTLIEVISKVPVE